MENADVLRGVRVRLLTDDLPRLYDFYTEKLGFKPFWGGRNGPFVSFAEVDGDTPAFAVFQKRNMNLYQGYVPLPGDRSADTVVFTTGTEDVDGYYGQLLKKGVELLGRPQNRPEWGFRCFYFRDPEGRLFEVAGPIR